MRIPTLSFILLLLAASTSAGKWPYGTFNYTVPFAKGGGSASIAELQAPSLPGAKLVYNSVNSGATAWGNMKNDPKDGSVITLVNLPHIYIQPYTSSINANYTADDISIAYVHSYTPLVLLVPAVSPIKTWADFVTACKTSDVTVSGAGVGTVFEVGSERLKKLARIPFSYVSAGSGADTAIAATLAGKFTAAWTTTPVVFNRTDLRVLAIAAEFEFPQIVAPTFKTLGINYVDGIYRAAGLPAGTPADVMKDVSDAINALNRNLSFISEVQKSGAVQMFMEYGSPSMKQFTSTYRKSVYNALFPVDPISRGSIYAMFVLGALGLLLTLVAAIFATIYRSTPVIKGSSYFFNNIILLGIILSYCSVIVYSFQKPLKGVTVHTLNLTCRAMPWLIGLGFDITFAAIIVKSYRLYRLFLFSASSIIQFDASNVAIAKWVLGICGINTLVYVVWTAHDPLSAILVSLDGEDTFYYSCQSRNTSAYLGVVLLLKYLMLSACIFFSVKLRELNAVLNESKAIAAATLSTTFILTICLAVYALVNSFEGRYIIFTGGIIIGATSCLGALFVPKIIVVVFSPDTNTFDHVRRIMKGSDLSRGASSFSGEVKSASNMLNSLGSLGSAGGLNTRRGSNEPVGHAASPAAIMPPIYVQEGRQLAREHRDRISALTRVIINTAANGMIGDFHTHVAKLNQYSSRIRVMANPSKSRTFSNPGVNTNADIDEAEEV
jgi:tripartite-type tricarboxylate transporter receptor subunit TctC